LNSPLFWSLFKLNYYTIHYKNGENLAQTIRKIQTFLGGHEAPCRTAIQKLMDTFELLEQVSDEAKSVDGIDLDNV